MTTELEALRRVAEAARVFFDAWDHGQATLGAIAEVGRALAALRALPAPAEPDGEVVEVRADVFRERDGRIVVREHGYMTLPHPQHIATIRARVPLPRVPEVVGEVG